MDAVIGKFRELSEYLCNPIPDRLPQGQPELTTEEIAVFYADKPLTLSDELRKKLAHEPQMVYEPRF